MHVTKLWAINSKYWGLQPQDLESDLLSFVSFCNFGLCLHLTHSCAVVIMDDISLTDQTS